MYTKTKSNFKTGSNFKKKSKRKSKKARFVSSSILTSRSTYKHLKTKQLKTIKNNNILNNKNLKNDELKSFTVSFTSQKFYSNTHTARRLKRISIPKDLLVEFIDDNHINLKNEKIFKNTVLDKYIFTDNLDNCICDNIFKKHLQEDCKCENMKTYSSQGFSGASIHSIRCNQMKNILKVVPLSTYYMKLRTQTKKYMFIEFDGFTIQTLINTYIHNELPNNTVNIVNSGACIQDKQNKQDKINGYNLMEEADLGSGMQFIENLIDGNLDNKLNINSEDIRYKTIVNFLLQVVLIIGHLQSSSLEFFHGDLKPENLFVKTINYGTIKKFKFNVFGKTIYVKNMGFSVLIADFDRSSISLNSNYIDKKYRIIPPILFKPLLTNYVNNIIKDYGDIDPDSFDGLIKIPTFFISNLIPNKKNPTITIMRSAGVKAFRDFDLYSFFIILLYTNKIRDYFLLKKIDKTILSFMSDKFKNIILSTKPKIININETVYIVGKILYKINEPMNNIFTKDYLKTLNILNYRLFR
jgi:hypothetical protein